MGLEAPQGIGEAALLVGQLAELGLALKDSAPGFDPTAAVFQYEGDYADDGDADYAEDEQL